MSELMEDEVYYAAVVGEVNVFSNKNEEQLLRKTSQNNNIIHIAAQHQQLDFIQAALERLPQTPTCESLICDQNCYGNTPLHIAAEVGDEAVVQQLYEYFTTPCGSERVFPWRVVNKDENTPAHVALLYGNVSLAVYLVEKDAYLARVLNHSKETLLHLAIQYHDFGNYGSQKPETQAPGADIWPIIELLLKIDSSVTCWEDANGATPLHRATSLKPAYCIPVIRAMLASCPKAAEVHDKGSGQTILHRLTNHQVASYEQGLELLHIPQVYALRNTKNHQGDTPLHLAARNRDSNMVQALLGSSAKLGIKNKSGVSAGTLVRQLEEVRSLHLNFRRIHGRRFGDVRYTLPEILHTNANLEELVICRCDFSKKLDISCSRLRMLSITQTRMNDELISRILGGCSALETLELIDCTGFDKLKIDSTSLRVLRIVGEQPPNFWLLEEADCVLEISGPYLVCLEVSGPLYKTKLRLFDVGRLVKAVMTFTIMPQKSDDTDLQLATRLEYVATDVLESLSRVKQLTVGGSIIKGLSSATYNLSSRFSERRSLTLCIPVIEWSHRGIASLLNSSPKLESLVIKLSYCSDMCVVEHADVPPENYWKSSSTISRCPLLHLKIVKVVGFQVSCQSMKPLFEFLEFLLTHSKALEKIVIHASGYVTRASVDDAMKSLVILTPSRDAIVHFEPPHLWVDAL